MGKNIVRDSIGSGQQCSDIFGLNSPNEAAMQRARARAYKDTLECAKNEKEGEFLLRIQGEGGSNPFLEGGKYFLMTLLYPPYFLLWAAPKWFGQRGAPKLYKVFQELNNMGRDFADRLSLPLRKTFHRVSALIKGWGQWMADASHQRWERMQKRMQKIAGPFEKMAEALKNLRAWRLPRFSFPKIGDFRIVFSYISFPEISLKKQWEEAQAKVDLMFAQLEQLAKTVFKPLSVFSKGVNNVFSSCKEFGQLSKEVLAHSLKMFRNAVPKFVSKERVEQIVAAVRPLLESLVNATKWGKEKYMQAKERVEEGLVQIAQLFPQPIINLFSFFMRFRKEETVKKRKRVSFKQRAAKVKERMKRGWKKLGQGKKLIKKILVKVHQSTRICALYTFKILKILGALIYKVMKQIAVALYLFFLWMRIFIVFVSKLVKSSLMHHLSIKA